MALLEEWLQLDRFERRGRRVALTEEGRAYTEAIAPALAQIRQATARGMVGEARALRIATLPSFGMRWVAPTAIAFDQFQMLAQAAIAGVGAALLLRFLIEPELAAGLLIAPFATPLPGSGAYYIAFEERRLAESRFCAFRDWLQAEANATVRPP